MDENQHKLQQLEQEIARLTQENAHLNEKLNAALDGSDLCLWEQHVPSGKLTIFNMEWGQMLGFQPSELDATVATWKSQIHPDDYDEVVKALDDHLAGKTCSYQVVHRMLHKDGSISWVADRGRVVEFDEQGRPLRMMGNHVDVTQEKRYELELNQLATTDPLTGVLNRSKLESEFHLINRTRPNKEAVLIFIDLDNFKQVNDHLGHHAGDKVLMQVAEWLTELAPERSRVARMGGDEFVLLCPNSDPQAVKEFATTLLARGTQPIRVENGLAEIGFSIGVCQFTTPHADFNMLYQLADEAMYRVKRSGKNGVIKVQTDGKHVTTTPVSQFDKRTAQLHM